MKFIFPQNYNFSTKLFGLIDYKTAILNFIFWIFSFFISRIFNFNLLTTIIFFIIICLPLLLFSLFGFYQENIIYVFKYVFIYLKRNKIYLYKKRLILNFFPYFSTCFLQISML